VKIRLLVLQGKLKNRHGASAGDQIDVRRSRLLIGSGEDCHVRVESRLVSQHHCELLVEEDRLHVQDLGSHTGTFVNELRIARRTLLAAGDRLRVGRLQFQVELEVRHGAVQDEDLMSDYVSDLLVAADQEDQARRMEDPRMRQFRVESPAATVNVAGEDEPERRKPPARRPPAKLPPPPKYVAETSVEAAEETLKKIFERPKRDR
jgi:pSer/pThr/pTyr-binding forkhead associated (FHA) protein